MYLRLRHVRPTSGRNTNRLTKPAKNPDSTTGPASGIQSQRRQLDCFWGPSLTDARSAAAASRAIARLASLDLRGRSGANGSEIS